MPTRFQTHRPEDVLTHAFFGPVRVAVTADWVFVVAAHGAYLPDDLEPALDYAARYTRGADSLAEFFGADEILGDELALVLIYPHN